MNDRGRVPFALIGVLLVVTSTTVVATTDVYSPQQQPDIDQAMNAATAAAMNELRGATDEAGTEAAIDPVIDPADTPAGRALSEDTPFEDALKLRIYLRAKDRLKTIDERHGAVTVAASLPDVEPTTVGYRTAIERVSIERTGSDDAALGVSIDGVRLSADRNGRTVTTVERSPEFTVSNPVLLLHDRTEQFETRANAPVTQPGVGQRLTKRLYPIAWSRGYAQYGGAPIATVLGTRHVELATNDALLAEQQAAFGEADPDGHRGVTAAGRRVATTDLIAGVGGDEEWADLVLDTADEVGTEAPSERSADTWREGPPDPEVTVGINESADRAFADLIGIEGTDTLAETIERTHTVDGRVVTSRSYLGRSRHGNRSPGPGWRSTWRQTSERTDVDRTNGRGPHSGGWRTQESATFDVTITKTTTRWWVQENKTTTTTQIDERRYRVRVAGQARARSVENVPDGRVTGALQEAADRAASRATSDAGGVREIARSTAHGRTVRSTATATASPAISRSELETELQTLREQSRDISVAVPAPAIGTGRANPSTQLRASLDDRLSARSADRSARERTIRAAQLAYLDALDAELSTRESAFDDAGDDIGETLGKHLSPDRIDGALAAHRAASSPSPEPIADPAGELSLAVDTAPSYLITKEVSRDRLDEPGGGTVYPLATKTVNLFTSPHGQVAEGVFDRIPFLQTKRVQLSTAARTLAALNESDPKHDRLETEVGRSTQYVRGELVAELVDAGVPGHAAQKALSMDGSTAEEALALTDGTTIERVARSVDGPVSTARLELRLKNRLDTELETSKARPRETTTTDAQKAARTKYGQKLEDALADGLEAGGERTRKEKLGKRLGALPAGLPLAPIPGYWYATANVWYVDVGGQYERFAVRANRSDATSAVTYLRDGRAASVTHQGESIHLGSAERVSVRTRTAVVVVVPPGPRGVGNTDGEMTKESPGWPP